MVYICNKVVANFISLIVGLLKMDDQQGGGAASLGGQEEGIAVSIFRGTRSNEGPGRTGGGGRLPFTQRWNKRSIEFQAEMDVAAGQAGRVAVVGYGLGEGGTAWQRGTENHLAWQGSTATRHTLPRTGIKHPPRPHTHPCPLLPSFGISISLI